MGKERRKCCVKQLLPLIKQPDFIWVKRCRKRWEGLCCADCSQKEICLVRCAWCNFAEKGKCFYYMTEVELVIHKLRGQEL